MCCLFPRQLQPISLHMKPLFGTRRVPILKYLPPVQNKAKQFLWNSVIFCEKLWSFSALGIILGSHYFLIWCISVPDIFTCRPSLSHRGYIFSQISQRRKMFKPQSFYSLRMARFRSVALMPVNLKIFLSSAAREYALGENGLTFL